MPLGPILGESRVERRLRERREQRKPYRRELYQQRLDRFSDDLAEYNANANPRIFRFQEYDTSLSQSRALQINRGDTYLRQYEDSSRRGVFLSGTDSRHRGVQRAEQYLSGYIDQIAGPDTRLAGAPPRPTYTNYEAEPEFMRNRARRIVDNQRDGRSYYWRRPDDSTTKWIAQPPFAKYDPMPTAGRRLHRPEQEMFRSTV